MQKNITHICILYFKMSIFYFEIKEVFGKIFKSLYWFQIKCTCIFWICMKVLVPMFYILDIYVSIVIQWFKVDLRFKEVLEVLNLSTNQSFQKSSILIIEWYILCNIPKFEKLGSSHY
jgi:hypothetical protein